MTDPTSSLELAALLGSRTSEERDPWTAADCVRLGREWLDGRALFEAIEILRRGLERWPDDVPLRQAMAVAWSRAEAMEEAAEILTQLVTDGHGDAETIGLLAATRKKLGLASGDRGTADLRAALSLYEATYRSDQNIWHGVNAATLARLLGDDARACDMAREVIALCQQKLPLPSGKEDYWLVATVAEASLVLDDLAAAEEWSRRAHSLVDGRLGMLGTTRRQFTALLDHAGHDGRLVDEWLPMPAVVVFAGHMIDLPGRLIPRFPEDRCAAVAAAIRGWLTTCEAGFGFSSAACGGDILFQEAMADAGAERCVILPFPEESFVRTSVDRDRSGSWTGRFQSVIAGARLVRASRTPLRQPELSYDYANQLLLGLARSHAQQFGASLKALVVWDGKPGDGNGGTASVVATCQRLGIPVQMINPLADGRHAARACSPQERAEAETTRLVTADPSLATVLFADALGFSRLPDGEVPLFVDLFLGRIGAVVDRYGSARITVRETWGDGLFFVFPDLEDAALFALEITELVNTTDWRAEGFSTPLKLRTALHHGPMYPIRDPITGRQAVCGAHIAQGARLEPKTPPGHVYATEAFAARAALEGHRSFRCTFVRQLEFDKRYGTFPAYVVLRSLGQPPR